ncbi:MAG TPA: PaaI family thioesterase [Acidimicrobiales bacterium]
MSAAAEGRLTEAEQQERRAAIPAIFAKTPFLAWLGLEVTRYRPDHVETRLPFRHELSNDGKTYHGGVVGAVIDTTGALAAWSNHDFDRGMRASTVSMALQYVAAASTSDILCRAQTVRRARELIFSEITASDSSGQVLAHALQTYRIA